MTGGRLLSRWKDFTGSHPAHRFWNDLISVTDSGVFDSSIIVRSSQVTDVYPLGLAAKAQAGFRPLPRNVDSGYQRLS